MNRGRSNIHLIRVWQLGALGYSIRDEELNVVQIWGVAVEGHILPNSEGLPVLKKQFSRNTY